MAAAQEMMVKVGRMTSSPGPRRRAAPAASRAAAVGDGDAVLPADAGGEGLLKARDEGPFGGNPAGVDALGEIALLVAVEAGSLTGMFTG